MSLLILGRVLSVDPVPEPVTGANVELWQFKGLSSSERIAQTTTDHTGSYQLTFAFTSICEESDRLLHWLEVSAQGYETATTYSNGDPNPPIYCTSSPQEVDLVMQPFGTLRAITNTGGSGLDPDGYLLQVRGEDSGAGGTNYSIGINEELVLAESRPGQYSLELVEVAGNCTVAGDNPRTVTVAARQETALTFQVSCAP